MKDAAKVDKQQPWNPKKLLPKLHQSLGHYLLIIIGMVSLSQVVLQVS